MPNRKFGAPRKFGTSTKFGASSDIGRLLSFGLMVDWDDNGLFDGTNEAANRMLSDEIRRGREFFLDSEGSGFQEIDTGRLTVELKDLDGRYEVCIRAKLREIQHGIKVSAGRRGCIIQAWTKK